MAAHPSTSNFIEIRILVGTLDMRNTIQYPLPSSEIVRYSCVFKDLIPEFAYPFLSDYVIYKDTLKVMLQKYKDYERREANKSNK
jgi:hypothetical protein